MPSFAPGIGALDVTMVVPPAAIKRSGPQFDASSHHALTTPAKGRAGLTGALPDAPKVGGSGREQAMSKSCAALALGVVVVATIVYAAATGESSGLTWVEQLALFMIGVTGGLMTRAWPLVSAALPKRNDNGRPRA